MAQLARAPALQAGGHRFESDYLHQKETTMGRFFVVEHGFERVQSHAFDLVKTTTLGSSLAPVFEGRSAIISTTKHESCIFSQQKKTPKRLFLFEWVDFV